MNDQNFDVAARYDFLCRALTKDSDADTLAYHADEQLNKLNHHINHDLVALARQDSPDGFTDILKNLNSELIRLREFCEFPDLATKAVVAVGGRFSAGKSSFLNTLLGKKQLVVEIDPTTSLPTYLLKGDSDNIIAINLFHNKISLSHDEFLSLTHDEKDKYGSQVGSVLSAIFISDGQFPWQNLALLDTPGYTKPDEALNNQRTDEDIARLQLNAANFIIWLVSAEDGVIKEDDLAFLSGLNATIPKLVLINKADKKTPEEVEQITTLTKQTLKGHGINVIDVLPVSRKKQDYPLDAVMGYFDQWNQTATEPRFAKNFAKQFDSYQQHLESAIEKHSKQLSLANQMIAISDDGEMDTIATTIKNDIARQITDWQTTLAQLEQLKQEFFATFNQLAMDFGMQTNNPSIEQKSNSANLLTATEAIQNMDIQSRKQIASSESLSDEQQIALAKDYSIVVHRALASNPKLCEEAQMLLLEQKKPDPIILKALCNNPSLAKTAFSVLESKLKKAGRNSLISMLYASYPFDEAEQAKIIANASNQSQLRALAKNPKLTNKNQALFNEKSESKIPSMSLFGGYNTSTKYTYNEEVRTCLAENPSLAKELQRELSKDKLEVLYALAKNPNLDKQLQSNLAKNSGWRVAQNLACNKNISEDTQNMLLNKQDPNFYSMDIVESVSRRQEHEAIKTNTFKSLAVNQAIAPMVQMKLAKMDSTEIKQALASLTTLHRRAQLILIDDSEIDVRATMAENVMICSEIEDRLLADEVEVKKSLAKNKHLNLKLQTALANESDNIPRILAANEYLLEEVQLLLCQSEDQKVRDQLAKNLTITPSSQLVLVNDEYKNSKELLAENINIIEEVQLILANDEDSDIRAKLASNIGIALSAQKILANGLDTDVIDNLLANPSLADEARAIILD
ncbi:dynamin family protein [Moraxella cuniculi]|uniref:GTPase Era n=1 Tax=Moraxella cuniculi TaxID=34061 RepID=A0A3S4SBF7_9GAMM|nr:dynamin family protein [Moraxella cuniculi]VEG12303.1 GTPase Era [Moraxella cuniculi]